MTTMTVEEFKKHIAKMVRERETGKKYSLIGASPAPEALKRKESHDVETE